MEGWGMDEDGRGHPACCKLCASLVLLLLPQQCACACLVSRSDASSVQNRNMGRHPPCDTDVAILLLFPCGQVHGD